MIRSTAPRVLATALSLALASPLPGWAAKPGVAPRAVGLSAAVPTQKDDPLPACRATPAPSGGRKFDGQTLTGTNLAFQNLRGATFNGAVLNGVNFIGADLTGADFRGATFVTTAGDPTAALFPTDFTAANLTRACFNQVPFNTAAAPVQFADATLSCAEFSHTDISTGNVLFGVKLKSDPLTGTNACHTSFRYAVMSCEFRQAWAGLELSGAVGLQTCVDRTAPLDLSNAILVGSKFENVDLTGTKWTGADMTGASFYGSTLASITGMGVPTDAPQGTTVKLSGASFTTATITAVDFSSATLSGAKFLYANITNSRFAGADFTQDASVGVEVAADFSYARLKNVDLSSATLTDANFVGTNLYGDNADRGISGSCQMVEDGCPRAPTGFTCGCSSLSGATLTGATFTNAFAPNVDFSGKGTELRGTKFTNAIVAGSNFNSATMGPNNGVATSFEGAFVQGADFTDVATLTNATFDGALFDFGHAGNPNSFNKMYLQLPSDNLKWLGWTSSSACVAVKYAAFSKISGSANPTCPSGRLGPCGSPTPGPSGSPDWKPRSGSVLPGRDSVKGNYAYPATYDDLSEAAYGGCNSGNVTGGW